MGFDWCQDVKNLERVQWPMPVIPVLGRLKQEDLQFETSLRNHGNSPSQEKERKEETKSMSEGSSKYTCDTCVGQTSHCCDRHLAE